MSKSKSDNSSSVARIYAQALLEIADADKVLEEVRQELNQLGEILESRDDLVQLLSSAVLSIQERSASLEVIFKGRVSDLVFRFLQVLNKNNRLAILPEIARAYGQLLDERNGVVDADLFVASELSERQVKEIGDCVRQAIGRKVRLHQQIHPNLIGGLRIRVGDRLMDGTVAAQLRLMRNALVDVGRQVARTDTEKLIQA